MTFNFNSFNFASKEMFPYIVHCLMGTPLRPESVRVVLKVRLQDRLNHY